MRAKRRSGTNFAFLWDGVIHLEDGSEWELADPTCRRDVIWWQSGEAVEFDRHRGALRLRNPARDEVVPVAATVTLELAA